MIKLLLLLTIVFMIILLIYGNKLRNSKEVKEYHEYLDECEEKGVLPMSFNEFTRSNFNGDS